MKKVEQFIERHRLIANGTTVLVAVSGGPDSVALLHFLTERRKEYDLNIIALTIDHQLRKDAIKEVIYVKDLCKQLEIPCVATEIDVKKYETKYKLSTQVAARKLRYQFFKEQMNIYQADYLALGHHADDQLETMLMGLVRSTNPSALMGIPYRRPFATGYIIRPFLCLTKEEIIHYCKQHRLQPKIDPSNEDVSYTRNYFRKHIAPLFKEQNKNIHLSLQRLSEALFEDEQFLQQQAKVVWKKIVKAQKNAQRLYFKRQSLLKQPIALQRRIYHLILNYLYDELPEQLTYTHWENFYSLLTNEKSYAKIHFPNRLFIEKSYDDIHLYFREQTSPYSFSPQLLKVPGEVTLPDGSTLKAEYVEGETVTDHHMHILPLGERDLPLYVRTRRAGDRMTWFGLRGRKKVKDIFIDEKIPHDQRDQWPIVTTYNGEIIWLIGLKKGQVQTYNVENQRYIKLTFKQEEREGD